MKLRLDSRKKDLVRSLMLEILRLVDIVRSPGLIPHEETRFFKVDGNRLKTGREGEV